MYTLLVTGDVPGAATYFNPLLQQTIIPCTSGTRPSSPAEGWFCHESDTDRLMKYTGSAWEAVSSSRQSFTPTLTAATTNPTLGTGSVSSGYYAYLGGGLVFYSFAITFGTTGAAAGTGQYLVSLPLPASGALAGIQPAMGSTMMRDSSASNLTDGTLYIPSSNLSVASALISGNTTIGAAQPWVWAATDYWAGSITYPIA